MDFIITKMSSLLSGRPSSPSPVSQPEIKKEAEDDSGQLSVVECVEEL
jgi:hypothetical protein